MFSTHQKEIEMRNLKRLYRSNYSISLSKSQNLKRVQEERQIKNIRHQRPLNRGKTNKKIAGENLGQKFAVEEVFTHAEDHR